MNENLDMQATAAFRFQMRAALDELDELATTDKQIGIGIFRALYSQNDCLFKIGAIRLENYQWNRKHLNEIEQNWRKICK